MVVGRKTPTEKEPEPEIYRMKIFSDNEVAAKSRFWYFLHTLRKMKKTTGDILTVKQVRFLQYLLSFLLLILLFFLATQHYRTSKSGCLIKAIIACYVTQIFEEKPAQLKNYGIYLRYTSRSGIHNMYKEYRDTTLTSAVGQLCKCHIAHASARLIP